MFQNTIRRLIRHIQLLGAGDRRHTLDLFEIFEIVAEGLSDSAATYSRNQALASNNGVAQKNKEAAEFQRKLREEDSRAMAEFGLWLVREGRNRELGLEYLARAALKNEWTILPTYSWYCLKTEKYDDYIVLYEACRNRIPAITDIMEEFHNEYLIITAHIDGNYALSKLATGSPFEIAEKIWFHHSQLVDHAESFVFPVVTAHKRGDFTSRDALAKAVKPGMWEETKEAMLKEQLTSKGWFKTWCKESYAILVELGH